MPSRGVLGVPGCLLQPRPCPPRPPAPRSAPEQAQHLRCSDGGTAGRTDGQRDGPWRSAFINCVGSSAQPSRPLSACRTLALKGHRAPANTRGAAELRKGERARCLRLVPQSLGTRSRGSAAGWAAPGSGSSAARLGSLRARQRAEGGPALVAAASALPGPQFTSDTCSSSGGVKTP